MQRRCVRFKHRKNNVLAPIMILAGLLITLIFVPFWAFMALLGIAVVVLGIYSLIGKEN